MNVFFNLVVFFPLIHKSSMDSKHMRPKCLHAIVSACSAAAGPKVGNPRLLWLKINHRLWALRATPWLLWRMPWLRCQKSKQAGRPTDAFVTVNENVGNHLLLLMLGLPTLCLNRSRVVVEPTEVTKFPCS